MGKRELYGRSILNGTSAVCGIISVVVWITVRALAGSPYDLLHKLNAYDVFPPIWLYSLLCLFWSFLVGFGAGILINEALCKRLQGGAELTACKGGLFFLAAFFFSFAHYPLFFTCEALLISLIVVLLSVICSAACAFYWSKVCKTASLILCAFSLWQIYIFFITLSVSVHR